MLLAIVDAVGGGGGEAATTAAVESDAGALLADDDFLWTKKRDMFAFGHVIIVVSGNDERHDEGPMEI